MVKTVKIRLFDSLAGIGFAYGKGENDVQEQLAAQFVKEGLAEYVGAPTAAKPSDLTEKAISKAAKTAQKR